MQARRGGRLREEAERFTSMLKLNEKTRDMLRLSISMLKYPRKYD